MIFFSSVTIVAPDTGCCQAHLNVSSDVSLEICHPVKHDTACCMMKMTDAILFVVFVNERAFRSLIMNNTMRINA